MRPDRACGEGGTRVLLIPALAFVAVVWLTLPPSPVLAVADADRTAERLSGPTWQHIADVGNAYGNAGTLGLGTLALLAAGQISGAQNVRAAGLDAGRALAYTYVI